MEKFSFEEVILRLEKFWKSRGFFKVTPLDLEVGAATLHPETFFRAKNKKQWMVFYTQFSRRPKDSLGYISKKLYRHTQFQVIFKPFNKRILETYIKSLEYIGFNRFSINLSYKEDFWKNSIIDAYGKGFEIKINNIEVTQLTFFKKIASNCCGKLVEITYGLERLCMILQRKNSINDIILGNMCGKFLIYKNFFERFEYDYFYYNKKFTNDSFFLNMYLNKLKTEIYFFIKKNKLFLAYEFLVKISHVYNILSSRKFFKKQDRTKIIFDLKKIPNLIIKKFNN